MPYIGAETSGDGTGILEIAELRTAREGRLRECHHRDRADDNQDDAEPQIGTRVTDKTRGNARTDDVALLEKELPRRHRGDADQQHAIVELSFLRAAGDQQNRAPSGR